MMKREAQMCWLVVGDAAEAKVKRLGSGEAQTEKMMR